MDLACMEDGNCHVPLRGTRDRDRLLELVRRKDSQLSRCTVFVGSLLLLQFVAVAALLALVVSALPRGFPDCKVSNEGTVHGISEHFRAEGDPNIPRALLAVNSSAKAKELEWLNDGDHTYMVGFTYKEGYLVVPRDGLYRVYLQITYRTHDHTTCNNSKMLLLNNTVVLRQESYDKRVAIIKSFDTVRCSDSENVFTKSLYNAAVFKLHANDRLGVSSSYPDLISHHQEDVFFGACLLS